MGGPNGVLHIIPGQEDLSHILIVFAKKFIVEMHHLTLSDGGGGLLHTQLGGWRSHSQLAGTDADGAGGDQNDLMPHALQVGGGRTGKDAPSVRFRLPVERVRVEVPTLTTTRRDRAVRPKRLTLLSKMQPGDPGEGQSKYSTKET